MLTTDITDVRFRRISNVQNTPTHTLKLKRNRILEGKFFQEHTNGVFTEGVSHPFLQQPCPVHVMIFNFSFFQIGIPWLTYRILNK